MTHEQPILFTRNLTYMARIVPSAVLALVAIFMIIAAGKMQIEYYDGLDTIYNAAYFLGFQEEYMLTRLPFLSWLIMPAEWIRSQIGGFPFDFRLHHILVAIVNWFGLVAVYLTLRRYFSRWTSLIVVLLGIVNYVFVTYAMFVNNDVLAGLLLVVMLHFWIKFNSNSGKLLHLVVLVLLGSIAVMIKDTFGAFLPAMLFIDAALLVFIKEGKEQQARKLRELFLASAIAGLFVWLLLSFSMGQADTLVKRLLLPWTHMKFVLLSGTGTSGENIIAAVSPFLFLKNAPAYGLLTIVMLLPGSIIAWRQRSPLRRAVLLPFVLFLPMQIFFWAEVRYFFYLVPLFVFVAASAVELLLKQNFGRIVIALIGVLHFFPVTKYGIIQAYTELHGPFYQGNVHRTALDFRVRRPQFLFTNNGMYGFRSSNPSPLGSDPYHRIFHFSPHHLNYFFMEGKGKVFSPGSVAKNHFIPQNSIAILSNGPPPANVYGGVLTDLRGKVQKIQFCDLEDAKLVAASGEFSSENHKLRMKCSPSGCSLIYRHLLQPKGRSSMLVRVGPTDSLIAIQPEWIAPGVYHVSQGAAGIVAAGTPELRIQVWSCRDHEVKY